MKNKINLQLFNYKLLKISVMKNFYKLLMLMLAFTFAVTASAQLEGAYKMIPEAAAMGVGPAQGDISWWSNSAADVETRACYFDDIYMFNGDGSFENILQDETWLETWQSDVEGCGTPVAPHDGMGDFTYTYDEGAGTLTLNGTGAYLGLPKAWNGGELTSPDDAPESITYIIDIQDDGDMLILDIECGTGVWWRFRLIADDYTPPAGEFVGMWQMEAAAAAMGVGPAQGDISWWANSAEDVITRACYFDDYYVFNEDGSFSNVQQDETWIETWQGEEGCGTPVTPHDGSNAATWTYDEENGNVTLNGIGAYMGLPKSVNGAELTSPNDAPEFVTYIVGFQDNGNKMVLDIECGTGIWWRFNLVYVGPVGVSEIESSDVSVFPNPAQDYVTIVEEFNSLQVYNVSGSLVLDIQQNQNQINVSDLSSGVYFIQMQTIDGQLKQSKFVKK